MTTIYQRLGEAEGIARIVDDVMAAHLANPAVNPVSFNAPCLPVSARLNQWVIYHPPCNSEGHRLGNT